MNDGSTSAARARNPWAMARTTLVVVGLGFVIASLAAACLDHYNEALDCSGVPGPGQDGGAADCDAGSTTTTTDGGLGSGSGSATP
ncbi:MAG: hypothetical protein QM820_11165 [Minicystis sp.]